MADLYVTVAASGGDYSSLSSAETTERATNYDLVNDDNTIEFNCNDFADTNAVTIDSSWVTDSTHYITVKVDIANRHSGTAGNGYRLVAGIYDFMYTVNADYTHTIGITLDYDTNNGQRNGIVLNSVTGAIIDSCLVYGVGNSTVKSYYMYNCVNSIVVNSISLDSVGNGFSVSYSTHGYFYFCTSINAGVYGFFSANNTAHQTYCKNCYAGNSGTADYYSNDPSSFYTTTCHDSDGSADTTTACAVGSGAYFTNVTPGNEDCHITSASSGLYQTGTDLSGDAVYPVSIDFEDDARNSNPCVGADEYLTGAIMNQLQKNNLGADLYNGSLL